MPAYSTLHTQGSSCTEHAAMLAGFHCESFSTVLDVRGLPRTLYSLVNGGAGKGSAGLKPEVGVLPLLSIFV